MEHCDRHGDDHIFYEKGRWTDRCPLCAALERISTLEQELGEQDETITGLEQERDTLYDEVRRLDVQLTALLRESVNDD